MSPDEKITTYIFWGLCENLINFFCDGPIKDAHHKRKKKKLRGTHNLINKSTHAPHYNVILGLVRHKFLINFKKIAKNSVKKKVHAMFKKSE